MHGTSSRRAKSCRATTSIEGPAAATEEEAGQTSRQPPNETPRSTNDRAKNERSASDESHHHIRQRKGRRLRRQPLHRHAAPRRQCDAHELRAEVRSAGANGPVAMHPPLRHLPRGGAIHLRRRDACGLQEPRMAVPARRGRRDLACGPNQS